MKTNMLVNLFITGIMLFAGCYAFAQDVLSPGDFVNQVASFVQGIGGMSTMLIVSGVIMLIIASMKVSILNQWIWSKLGSVQIWVAPSLGLIAGVLSLGSGITLPAAFAYVTAGAGAVYLHEILDQVKNIPGIGAIYVSIITTVEGWLGGPAASAPQLKKAKK